MPQPRLLKPLHFNPRDNHTALSIDIDIEGMQKMKEEYEKESGVKNMLAYAFAQDNIYPHLYHRVG